jgi:hypothetical protein
MLRKLFLCFASVAAASVASGLIVVVIDPVTSAGAQGWTPFPTAVNRTLKGDRLQGDQVPMHIATQPRSQSAESERSETPVTLTPAPKRAPVGCDPSFSPVASPSLANIFGRCTT